MQCTVLYCIAVPVPKTLVWGKTRFRANLNSNLDLAASSHTTKASRCQWSYNSLPILSLVLLVSGASYKASYKLLLHQFCMTFLLERGVSNITNANKVSYEVSYVAPLTRKTKLQKGRIVLAVMFHDLITARTGWGKFFMELRLLLQSNHLLAFYQV